MSSIRSDRNGFTQRVLSCEDGESDEDCAEGDADSELVANYCIVEAGYQEPVGLIPEVTLVLGATLGTSVEELGVLVTAR